jgi:drug/metabolite transporter (DMT)-like permease
VTLLIARRRQHDGLAARAVVQRGRLLHRHARGEGQGATVDLMPAVFVGAVLSAAVTAAWALPAQATAQDLGWLALLGVFQLALPCLLAVMVAQRLSPTEVSLLSLLEVVFGVAWAWWGTDEAPSASVLAGGALVLGALVVNEAWPKAQG